MTASFLQAGGKMETCVRGPVLWILLICCFLAGGPPALPAEIRVSIPMPQVVPEERLRDVYEQVKTPYKFGVVLRGEDNLMVDCPCVFRHADRWLMMYICMNKVGYETHLAESHDLLSWEPLGKVLSFRDTGWDRWQASGGLALIDTAWGGPLEPERFNNRYWLSYMGGELQGYETDPLSIGMASSGQILPPREWDRHEKNPALSSRQADAREFEALTLYKSTVIRDPDGLLGKPFVMFYNAKPADGHESIGLAVSDDLVTWHRYGKEPVVDNGSGISGDPQVIRLGDLWVMFYFGAFWQPGAFDTFACSYNLVDWTKWTGPHLVEPSEPWDREFAHKPWVVLHDGVVYHFYCAVGEEGRVIALATSKPVSVQ